MTRDASRQATRHAEARAPSGLVDRMARTWTSPRAGVRREIETAEESRLLFYAFAASALGVMAAVGGQLLNPSVDVGAQREQWIVTQVVVGLFIRPIGLYAAAGLMGLACRAAGGAGGWRDTRAACFWTALTAAPAAVALAVLSAGAEAYGVAPVGSAAVGLAAGSVLWALLLAPGLAEAHGFRSALPVFAAFAALAAAAGLLGGLAG